MHLEIPVRPQRLTNVPRPAMLGVQLHRLKVRDIVRVEEHVPHRCRLAVHPEGVSREDDPFDDDPRRVWVEKGAHGDELGGLGHMSMRLRVSDRGSGVTHRARCPTLAKAYRAVSQMRRVRIRLRRLSYRATGNVQICGHCWRLYRHPVCVGCRSGSRADDGVHNTGSGGPEKTDE